MANIISSARARLEATRAWAEQTMAWKVWERMLECEFVDRSVALAAKGFVSFFPLIIVAAAFMPDDVRKAIFTNVTGRLGVSGSALTTAKAAFATSKDVRRATGVLGLVFAFFYASSFTTALQRVYLRAWRRPPGGGASNYVRGPVWMVAILVYFALLGGARRAIGGPEGTVTLLLVGLGGSLLLWWITARVMLRGHIHWRPLVASAAITGLAMTIYGATAGIWMPRIVINNQHQFGFFGVALALVTWFSGAALCIVIGTCAGAVLAEDPGIIGKWLRGSNNELLTPKAPPALPPPIRAPRLVDALGGREEDDS